MSAHFKTPSWGNSTFIRKPKHKVIKLTLQKLIGQEFITTAHADNLEAAERHAAAVGGEVRALDQDGAVVEVWRNP